MNLTACLQARVNVSLLLGKFLFLQTSLANTLRQLTIQSQHNWA